MQPTPRSIPTRLPQQVVRRIAQRYFAQQRLALMLFSVLILTSMLLTSACQPGPAPAPTTAPAPLTVTAEPTQRVIAPTRTAASMTTRRATIVTPETAPSPLPPSPSPTPARLDPSLSWTPTPSPEPALSLPAAALSSTGPWLVMLWDVPLPESPKNYYELALFNPDGSGRTIVRVEDCRFDVPITIQPHPSNRLAQLYGNLYLIQPDPPAATLLCHAIWDTCRTAYRGNSEEGLLARIDQSADPAAPVLRIEKLPEGKTWFGPVPLVEGTTTPADDTGMSAAFVPLIEWSPRGRYLAYSAALGGGNFALYVYDSINGDVRRLAAFDQSITQVWWSPGNKWIITATAQHADVPSTDALWAVPLAGGPLRAIPVASYQQQEILGWLDEDRFMEYDGSLYRIVEEGAANLRLVEIPTGTVTDLFRESMLQADFDPETQTIALSSWNGPEGDGLYLFSLADPTPHRVGRVPNYQLEWDRDFRLFVTGDECASGAAGIQAYDTSGKPRCIATPEPQTVFPSPDGAWEVTLKDGLWVKQLGKPDTQLRALTPTQVIWAPDSSGFFFVARKMLYHVSLPDLSVTLVDAAAGSSELPYQWLKAVETP